MPHPARTIGKAIVKLGRSDREESAWLRANDTNPAIGEPFVSIVRAAFRAGYLLALADSLEICDVEAKSW